jgi:hypothetical protein
MISLDYIFSYWIFLLFVVYLIYPTKYTNPTILLTIGLIEQILSILYYIYIGVKWSTLFIFFVIMFSIKIVPLYLLRRSKEKWNPVFSLCVILAYLLYLMVMKQDVFKIYVSLDDSIIRGTNESPFFYFINNINLNLT